MNNFSGVLFRIWGVCGIIFLLGVTGILLDKPWSKNFKIRKCKAEIAAIAFAVCLGLIYASRILFPDVSSYTGEFIDSHRDSGAAPPLPVTSEYVFWTGEGTKKCFYLDTFSKKKIYPFEFEKGKEYTVYFDKFTKVIVRVEVSE